jgi:hypothetical protein
MQVWPEAAQVEQRVGHQLSRPVVRHLPAALGAVQGRGRGGGVEPEVRLGGPGAQGVDGGVLQQEDDARKAACGGEGRRR